MVLTSSVAVVWEQFISDFSVRLVCVCGGGGGGEGEGDLSCRLNGNISEKQALISDISQFFLLINENEYQHILSPY